LQRDLGDKWLSVYTELQRHELELASKIIPPIGPVYDSPKSRSLSMGAASPASSLGTPSRSRKSSKTGLVSQSTTPRPGKVNSAARPRRTPTTAGKRTTKAVSLDLTASATTLLPIESTATSSDPLPERPVAETDTMMELKLHQPPLSALVVSAPAPEWSPVLESFECMVELIDDAIPQGEPLIRLLLIENDQFVEMDAIHGTTIYSWSLTDLVAFTVDLETGSVVVVFDSLDSTLIDDDCDDDELAAMMATVAGQSLTRGSTRRSVGSTGQAGEAVTRHVTLEAGGDCGGGVGGGETPTSSTTRTSSDAGNDANDIDTQFDFEGLHAASVRLRGYQPPIAPAAVAPPSSREYQCLDDTAANELHYVLTSHSQRLLEQQMTIQAGRATAPQRLESIGEAGAFGDVEAQAMELLSDEFVSMTPFAPQPAIGVVASSAVSVPLSLSPRPAEKDDSAGIRVEVSVQEGSPDAPRRRLAFQNGADDLVADDVGTARPNDSLPTTNGITATFPNLINSFSTVVSGPVVSTTPAAAPAPASRKSALSAAIFEDRQTRISMLSAAGFQIPVAAVLSSTPPMSSSSMSGLGHTPPASSSFGTTGLSLGSEFSAQNASAPLSKLSSAHSLASQPVAAGSLSSSYGAIGLSLGTSLTHLSTPSALSASIAHSGVAYKGYRPFFYFPRQSSSTQVSAALQRAEIAFHRFDAPDAIATCDFVVDGHCIPVYGIITLIFTLFVVF
jgi:hypothetical protein